MLQSLVHPHPRSPRPDAPQSPIKLLMCPYNYHGHKHVSHTGLGISVLNTTKVLREAGHNVFIRPVTSAPEIQAHIDQDQPTHVNTSAMWVPTDQLAALCHRNQHVTFSVTCHSNIAFLQVEPNALKLLREAADLESSTVNFHLAGNSHGFVQAIRAAWERNAVYLPNLYSLTDAVRTARPTWQGGTLRIGAFGASRPLKNPTASAFAALQIATDLHTNLEFHINSGRLDGNSDRMLQAVRAIYANLPYAKLVEDPWCPWTSFRLIVRNMHLLLQPSFTESFNVVTADGVHEGVPSVVSDTIEWAPDSWKITPDDVNAIARTGLHLLHDMHAGRDGFNALTAHNTAGVQAWRAYLDA